MPSVRILSVLRSRLWLQPAVLSAVLPSASLDGYDWRLRAVNNHWRNAEPRLYIQRCDLLINRIWRTSTEVCAMFNPYDMWNKDDEPLFYTNTLHPLDFSCQCKACVRQHTITMDDRDFLRSIGIVWKAIIK